MCTGMTSEHTAQEQNEGLRQVGLDFLATLYAYWIEDIK